MEKLPRDIPICDTLYSRKKKTVELRYKGVPMPLPPWFWTGWNAALTSFRVITNLISYVKNNKSDEYQRIFSELEDFKYQRQTSYFSNLIRFPIQVGYTSIQAYEILHQEFPLPSCVILEDVYVWWVYYLTELLESTCPSYFMGPWNIHVCILC